jgi:hypothetical protein
MLMLCQQESPALRGPWLAVLSRLAATLTILELMLQSRTSRHTYAMLLLATRQDGNWHCWLAGKWAECHWKLLL